MKVLKFMCAGVLALFVLACTGCQFVKYTYVYDQSIDKVEKVEICRYDYATKTVTPVATMDAAPAENLLTDITLLDCYKAFGDGSRDYGEIVIYITYLDGTAEVQGMVNSASIDLEGNWWIKSYYFDYAQWCSVVLQYVDPEIVPELGRYVEDAQS